MDRWTSLALLLAMVCVGAMAWSIYQVWQHVPGATISPLVESISALVLTATAYYAKRLVDTHRETESTRRTLDVLNSQLVASGMQALAALIAPPVGLGGARNKTAAMIAAMGTPGWAATTPDEVNINAVSSAYTYMAVVYARGLLDLELLRPYALTIVSAFFVVDPMIRNYMSARLLADSILKLGRSALSMCDVSVLHSMGIGNFTI